MKYLIWEQDVSQGTALEEYFAFGAGKTNRNSHWKWDTCSLGEHLPRKTLNKFLTVEIKRQDPFAFSPVWFWLLPVFLVNEALINLRVNADGEVMQANKLEMDF